MMKKTAFFLFLLFLQLGLFAQEKNTFSVGIQIRPRFEFRNGQGELLNDGDNPAAYVSNRARIYALFSSQKIDVKVAGQSVGVWGQQPQIETYGGFMLNEAWAALKINSSWTAVVGRQPLIYDDERIFGGLDWHVAGRFHDAVLIKMEKKRAKLHVGGALSANSETKKQTFYEDTGQPYKNMAFAWAEFTISDPLKITLLALNTGLQSGVDSLPNTWEINYMQTLGANLIYEGKKLKARALFYQQLGENAAEKDVNAFLWSIYGSYRVAKKWDVLAGIDVLSGNAMNATTNDERAFAPPFGTNHGIYGYMDYFFVGNYFGNVGLRDIYGGLKFYPNQNLSIRAAAHFFGAMATVIDANGLVEPDNLGTEIDLSAKYKLRKGVAISGGYSQMFATESMEIVKGGGDKNRIQNWAWLMLNVDLEVFAR